MLITKIGAKEVANCSVTIDYVLLSKKAMPFSTAYHNPVVFVVSF